MTASFTLFGSAEGLHIQVDEYSKRLDCNQTFQELSETETQALMENRFVARGTAAISLDTAGLDGESYGSTSSITKKEKNWVENQQRRFDFLARNQIAYYMVQLKLFSKKV